VETLAPPVVGDGKGKATPKRRESQAARKQPLVPSGRTTAGKGASKEVKAAARAERMRGRELMMAGDERYLLARDKGPVRRFVRDEVDSRYNVGEFLLPVMLVVVILSFSGLQTRAPGIFAIIFVVVYAMLVVAGIDAFLLTRRIRRRVAERFGADSYGSGTGMYAVFRAFQLRRSRVPRPGVKRGQQPR
jgi:uncharacterized membrane protein YtjA (UPF0391 family)